MAHLPGQENKLIFTMDFLGKCYNQILIVINILFPTNYFKNVMLLLAISIIEA